MSDGTKKGKTLDPAKAPDSEDGLTPSDPDLARQKVLTKKFMRDDSEVLKELAK